MENIKWFRLRNQKDDRLKAEQQETLSKNDAHSLKFVLVKSCLLHGQWSWLMNGMVSKSLYVLYRFLEDLVE